MPNYFPTTAKPTITSKLATSTSTSEPKETASPSIQSQTGTTTTSPLMTTATIISKPHADAKTAQMPADTTKTREPSTILITTETAKSTTTSTTFATTTTETATPSTTNKFTKTSTNIHPAIRKSTISKTTTTTKGITFKITKNSPKEHTTEIATIKTTPRTTTSSSTMSPKEEHSGKHLEEQLNCCDCESAEEIERYSDEHLDYDSYDSWEITNKQDRMNTNGMSPAKPQANVRNDHTQIKENILETLTAESIYKNKINEAHLTENNKSESPTENTYNNTERTFSNGIEKQSEISTKKTLFTTESSVEDDNQPQKMQRFNPESHTKENPVPYENQFENTTKLNTQQTSLPMTIEVSADKRLNNLGTNGSNKGMVSYDNKTANNQTYYNPVEIFSKANSFAIENLVPILSTTQPIIAPSEGSGLFDSKNGSTIVFSRDGIRSSQVHNTQEIKAKPITYRESDNHLINNLSAKLSEILKNLESEDSSEELSNMFQDQQSYYSEESLEKDFSYELPKTQNSQHPEPDLVKENAPKFSVYSNEAYGLDNLYNNNIDIKQDDRNLEYSITTPAKEFESNDNLLRVYEALLDKCKSEEDNDEYLVNKVLSTLAIETTSAPSIFDDTTRQLNHTKREEYLDKNNATTTNKKGEIYNGVVYKAPVYDAPTYNIIYTSPHHVSYPWVIPNNQIPLNYPGILENPHDGQTMDRRQSTNVHDTNLSFNPLEFLRSLSNMHNSMPLASATENKIRSTSNDEKVSPLTSLYPSPHIPINPLMPETHPMPAAIISPKLSSIPNLIPPLDIKPYQSNTVISKENIFQNTNNLKYQPLYSFPPPANPLSRQPSLNVVPYQPSITITGYKNSALPSSSASPAIQATHSLTYPHNIPTYNHLNSPNSDFNITVFNKLLESLKTLK